MATLFRENGIDHDRINYFKESFTEKNLGELIGKTGLRPHKLVRGAVTAGITDETPDAEVINAIIADPNLLQRPIVAVGDRAILARPIDKALELIGEITEES